MNECDRKIIKEIYRKTVVIRIFICPSVYLLVYSICHAEATKPFDRVGRPNAQLRQGVGDHITIKEYDHQHELGIVLPAQFGKNNLFG